MRAYITRVISRGTRRHPSLYGLQCHLIRDAPCQSTLDRSLRLHVFKLVGSSYVVVSGFAFIVACSTYVQLLEHVTYVTPGQNLAGSRIVQRLSQIELFPQTFPPTSQRAGSIAPLPRPLRLDRLGEDREPGFVVGSDSLCLCWVGKVGTDDFFGE